MAQRILVADDEPDVLELLVDRLSSRGYDVISAADGQTALEMIKSESPQLAVLDNKMPGLNGVEICRQMKADTRLRSIAVLLITAATNSMRDGLLEGVGVDSFLLKPYESSDLFQQVESLIGIAA